MCVYAIREETGKYYIAVVAVEVLPPRSFDNQSNQSQNCHLQSGLTKVPRFNSFSPQTPGQAGNLQRGQIVLREPFGHPVEISSDK